ncbi:MAG: acetyl ornithine aminotransferase family protein [Bdellovibrionia bacterium]
MKNLRPEIKTQPPGPKAKLIIEKDTKYASPSYIKEYPLVVDRGEGSWIYDVDGNRYLDFMAGIATTSTGHAHPKVVQAIKDAADKFLHICGTDFYYQSFSDLMEKLAGYVPGMGPKKIFLTNSGTEAVEGAIKLARYHTKRNNLIAFKGAFHGRTLGAVALTSSKVKQRAHFGPLMPGITHVPYPNPYRCAYGKPTHDANCKCLTEFDTDLFSSHLDPKEVAAIFIEPILGEGGYVMPPVKFLKNLRKMCDEHGILLVFDEIQCGVGRTGQMFAADLFDVAPDILLSAKGIASGMPIGAIIAKESVMTWPRSSHGSTYGGNPVCCAAAIATLEIVEGLLPQIRENGEIFLRGLRDLQKKHPIIGDVRGTGFMIGAEFVEAGTKNPASEYVARLEQLAFKQGLLLLSCGQSTIRFAPPLIMSPDEIKVGLEVMDYCMGKL